MSSSFPSGDCSRVEVVNGTRRRIDNFTLDLAPFSARTSLSSLGYVMLPILCHRLLLPLLSVRRSCDMETLLSATAASESSLSHSVHLFLLATVLSIWSTRTLHLYPPLYTCLTPTTVRRLCIDTVSFESACHMFHDSQDNSRMKARHWRWVSASQARAVLCYYYLEA